MAGGHRDRDPQKWPMSMKNGVGVIALESSRRLGCQVPLYCAVTWGAASINHWWPWPRKNVVMCYDEALDYADLLDGCDSWGRRSADGPRRRTDPPHPRAHDRNHGRNPRRTGT